MSYPFLSLAHQPLIEEQLAALDVTLSEYSFPNLYLFRETHAYQVGQIEGYAVITGLTYDQQSFVMPLFTLTPDTVAPLIELAQCYDFIFPIAENDLDHFMCERFVITYCIDDADYLYTTAALAHLAEPNLKKVRNLRNRLGRNYCIEVAALTGGNQPDALAVLAQWQAAAEQNDTHTDCAACWEAIAHCQQLNLTGLIFYADQRPAGFLIFEEQESQAVLIHFWKGDRCLTGIYQFMMHHFAQTVCARYPFINLMQDLGLASLRHAKSAYRPVQLLTKYRVRWIT